MNTMALRVARPARSAFTLLELLVVIGIMALLLGLVLPGVGRALRAGRAVTSLSNVRQWGLAAHMYAASRQGMLPWDGADSVSQSISAPDWWANALPPMIDSAPYSDLVASGHLPLPPAHTIFTDPSALVPPGAPYVQGGVRFFFCYVPNSKLNSGQSAQYRVNVEYIPRPSATVLMVEMRTTRDELPRSHPYYSRSLDRAKADWQRFANRHRKGGHIAFVDGHAAHVTTERATQSVNGNFNQEDLIWNPFGVAN